MRWRKWLVLAFFAPFIYVALTAAQVWLTSKQDQRTHTQAIVVMGAAQYDGRPSTIFRARLDHARVLFKDDVAPLVVILGGKQRGDRFTEAQAGAAYLEQSLPANKVTGVQSGSTTLESLQQFKVFARERKISRITVVSDPLHLARTKRIARDLGFETNASRAPMPISRRARRFELIRETLNLIYYRFFGA